MIHIANNLSTNILLTFNLKYFKNKIFILFFILFLSTTSLYAQNKIAILKIVDVSNVEVLTYTAGTTTGYLNIVDPDRNTGTGTAEVITATISSQLETLGESVSLTETGVNTGIFVGSFTMQEATGATAGDSKLQVKKGDKLTATYVDPKDDFGNQVTVTDVSYYGVTLKSGVLSASETWTKANSPFLVTGDVTVGINKTLTIEPGVEIKFVKLSDDKATGDDINRSEIIIDQGTLIAEGSATDSIRFTSNAEVPSKSDWYGITIKNIQVIRLKYVALSYANYGFKVNAGELHSGDSIRIENSHIRYLSSQVIGGNNINFYSSGAVISIVNNTFTDVSDIIQSIWLQSNSNGVVRIDGNKFYLSGSGMYSGSLIQNCYIIDLSSKVIVSNNLGRGSINIQIYEWGTLSGTATDYHAIIENNIFTGQSNISFTGKKASDGWVLIKGNKFDSVNVSIATAAKAVIADNTIKNAGLSLTQTNALVERDSIINNNNSGISVSTDFNYLAVKDTIRYCTITGNNKNNNSARAGVLISDYGNPVLQYNNIYDNNIYDVRNDGTVNEIDARYNWWGQSTTTEMATGANPTNITKIYDYYDNNANKFVNYAQWATSIVTNTGLSPIIFSFTPTTGVVGTTVTITGTNFTGATSVKFGGTEATSFVVVSAASITAVVANGASGVLSVTTIAGATTSTDLFTFIFPPPTITSFTPTTSGAGATVTITGTNFIGATSVKFGGTEATSFVVVSATSITAVVASGTTGPISVTTPSGIATGKVEIASNLVANNTSSWTPAWQKITTVSSGVLSNVVLKLGNNSSTNDYSLYLVLHKTDNDPSLAGDIDTKFTSLIETSNAVTITRNTSAKEITFAFPGINILDASKSYYVVLKESQGNPAGTGQQLIYFNFSATVTFGGAGGIFGNLYYKFLMSPVFYFTPTITSFTPTTGGSGETITITGTNFIGTTSVTFGGTEATSFTVVSATSITAVVASGTTGVIVVTTTAGSATSSGIFIFTLAQSITSFSPTSGAVGTTITITGKGFTGATSVKFGGTEATSFVVVSATSITAVVASGTTGTIVVITPGGTATSSGTFTFIQAPTISSFTPSTSGAGVTITITGTNLAGATSVTFGGTAATSFVVVSATSITAVVASGTTGTISVITPGGTATSSGTFTFIQAPTITSFTPTTSGAGATITITGTNFTGATSVTFGGTSATSFVVVSAASITAVVANGATGTISVTTPGGTATSSVTFTFIPAPTITSFTPTTSGAGATITITGTTFTGATIVKFGGTAATSFVVVSATSITAVVATGTTGTISVTTPGGTATSGGTFTFIQVPTLVDLVYPKNDTTNIPLNLIFKWNKVSTATRYRIHISTVSTFATFVKDTIVTDTTFKANGLNVNTKYYWRVSGINLGGEGLFSTIRAFTTGTNTFVKNNNIIPSEFILSQNYPNPFNPSTTISFGLPFESKVRFEIYNSAGQIVKVISEEELSAGYYNYKFHIDVPTGIYFYRMVATSNEAGNKTFTQTKKMMLMK